MWASPARVTTAESRYAHRRLLMKSYLGETKIWSMVASDAQRLEAPAAHVQEVEDEPSEEHRGEEARQDADHERDREALHGAGPELIEDDRRHHDGHVGVDDRGEGALEPRVDGGPDGLAEPEFLPDALEDQDVRVDRHADGQHDPG